MILMSAAIALVQFVVGSAKLGRRKAGVPGRGRARALIRENNT
jgi:hypothetical protein